MVSYYFIYLADRMYITHVTDEANKDIIFDKNKIPDTFIEQYNKNFDLIGISETYTNKYKDVPIKHQTFYYKKKL